MKDLKIFISSTYIDLKDYRAQLQSAIGQMELSCIAMENWGAQPAEPSKVCDEKLNDCNVFIGIYGFRYGFIPENKSLSITESEYKKARKLQLRCLCYFLDDSLKQNFKDIIASEPEENQQKLYALKKGIWKSLVCKTVNSPDDLAAKVTADISQILRGSTIGLIPDEVVNSWLKNESQVLDQLCESEPDLQITHLEYDSPLQPYWQEFVTQESWHDKIFSLKNNITGYNGDIRGNKTFTRLIDELGKIKYDSTYFTILNTAKSKVFPRIVDTINNLNYISSQKNRENITEEKDVENDMLRNNLGLFKALIEKPFFAKCFLVIGNKGAGKTHFTAKIMSERSIKTDKHHQYLALRLDLNKYDKSCRLEEFILEGIKNFSGALWKTIKDFDELLSDCVIDTCGGQKKIVSNPGKNNNDAFPIKLMIVIDDVNEWKDIDPQFINKLNDFISRHTSLHSIYWVLTLNNTSYPEMSLHDLDEFQKYSWFTSYLATSQVKDYKTQSKDNKTLDIMGWISLDALNSDYSTGISIIKNEFSAKKDELDFAMAVIDNNETLEKNLSKPFIAWILFELKDKIPLRQLISLNYIEIVQRFWEKRLKSKEISIEQRGDMEECVDYIVKYFVASCTLSPIYTALKDKIVKYASGVSELKNETKLEFILSLLQHQNFLEKYFATDGSTKAQKIKIHYENFWEWKIAGGILDTPSILQRQIPITRPFLEDWFKSLAEPDDIKEGIFQFILLLIDQTVKDEGVGVNFSKEFWDMRLKSHKLPTQAIWFAASMAQIDVQQKLISSFNPSSYDPGSKRELFAFMLYLIDTPREVLLPLDRLKYLVYLSKRIKSENLIPYFYHIAIRIMSEIDDNNILVECMISLRSHEDLNITKELASYAVNRLIDNVNGRIEDVSEFILEYLHFEKRYADRDRKIRVEKTKTTKWIRYFFREWVLFYLFFRMTEQKGISSFYILKNWGLLTPGHLKLKEQIELEIERETSIAIGGHYRRSFNFQEDNNKEMEMLISDLIESEHIKDREMAFHIIRHTNIVEEDTPSMVHPELKGFLHTIYHDPELSFLKDVETFMSFFKKNLEKKS